MRGSRSKKDVESMKLRMRMFAHKNKIRSNGDTLLHFGSIIRALKSNKLHISILLLL